MADVSPFYVALEVVKERVESLRGAMPRVTISLHPPFVFVNLLPVPLVYRLMNERVSKQIVTYYDV